MCNTWTTEDGHFWVLVSNSVGLQLPTNLCLLDTWGPKCWDFETAKASVHFLCSWMSMVHDYESFLFCFRPGEAIKGAYCLTCWSSWSFRTRVPRIGVLFVWTLAWLALKHIDTVDTVDISVQVESLEASNSIQFLQSMKRSSGWGVPLLLVAAVVWTILGWSSKADGATWHDVLKFWNSLLVLECLDGFVHSNCKPRGSVCA